MIVSAGGILTQLTVWQHMSSSIIGKSLMKGYIQELEVTLGPLLLKTVIEE
jgi:hypothetical protein